MDLVSWLKDPEREIRVLEAQLETNSDTTESLQSQLGDLNSELDRQASELGNMIEELYLESTNMKDTVTELDRRNVELQSALDLSTNLVYLVIGIALIAIVVEITMVYRRLHFNTRTEV
jgi:peptidoglycan hydrolase CwlO-like protein